MQFIEAKQKKEKIRLFFFYFIHMALSSKDSFSKQIINLQAYFSFEKLYREKTNLFISL